MKFSVTYNNKFLPAEELKCPAAILNKSFDFIKNNPLIRYNIEFDDNVDIDLIVKYLESIEVDYTIKVNDIGKLRLLLNKNYRCYLNVPVTDWESFSCLKNMGVSDVIIDGPLGFQTDVLKNIKKNVNIRVIPNYSFNADFYNNNNLNSFFIRPEDLKAYEGTIDYIEFKEEFSRNEELMFKIYKRGNANLSLNMLIKHCNETVDNEIIDSSFVKNRLNCGQRCMRDSSCKICITNIQLSKKIKSMGEERRSV